MIDAPRTLEEAKRYRYRVWSGNPNGYSYHPGRCAYEVYRNLSIGYQCRNKNGKGVNGLYCGTHARMVK